MGYPMTYRRVVNRNGLAEGGYGAKISGLNTGGSGRTMVDLTADDFQPGVYFVAVLQRHIGDLYREIDRVNTKWSCLVGDLRRLERDVVDENAVCRHIAEQSHVDVETVAMVLKEFMGW